MSIRKIVTSTLYYGIVPKLSMFVSILILPLTTPFLSTYDYGIWGVVSSYSGLLFCIAPLGLNLHLANSFYEIPRKWPLVWGRIFYLTLMSGILFGIVNMLILFFTVPIESRSGLFLLCVIGSMQIFLLSSPMLAKHLYPLVEQPKPLVFTNLFGSLCGILISFVFIYYLKLGYWGLVANTAVNSLIVFLLFSYQLNRQFGIVVIFEKNFRRVKSWLKSALPLVPHTLGFVLLTSSARMVMGQYHLDYDDIGLYSHGCTMGDYVVIIPTALVTAISPQLQVSFRGSDLDRYRTLFYLCQCVALLSSFLICIWMDDIYSLLIRNDELRQSASIAKYMCFAQVLLPLYWFMSTSCFIERNTKQLLWLVFVPGILNLVLCELLIPFCGYRVAIYTTIISYWSQLAIPLFVPYFRNKTSEWLGSKNKLLVLTLVVVLFLFGSNFLAFLPWSSKLVVSLVSIVFFMLFFHRYKMSDTL